jgi:hypothetical protein
MSAQVTEHVNSNRDDQGTGVPPRAVGKKRAALTLRLQEGVNSDGLTNLRLIAFP